MEHGCKRIILEIDVDQVDHFDDQLMDQCKSLFIRIMKKFSPSSIVVRPLRGSSTNETLPFFICGTYDNLYPDEEVIRLRWSGVHRAFISKCVRLILDHLEDNHLNTFSLADKLHLSKASFYRKIKLLTNLSAKDFIKLVKMQAALQLLSGKSYTVSEVAWKCGYSSARHFSKLFFQTYQTLPSRVE
jgi:AraC-like DNA-binding protein